MVSGIEGVIEGAKWILWIALWFIPPMYLADQFAPKGERLILIVLWFIPTAAVMFLKGREGWKRGEWEHQLRKKESQKREG